LENIGGSHRERVRNAKGEGKEVCRKSRYARHAMGGGVVVLLRMQYCWAGVGMAGKREGIVSYDDEKSKVRPAERKRGGKSQS